MPENSWYGERIGENLKREILWVITNEMNDPRLPKTIIVPNINLAKDNKNATVFVSVLADEIEQNEAIKVLNKAAGFIQSTTAKRVKIKHFPKLFFKLDKSFEYQENVDYLLEKVRDDLE
ncbi:MAG: 30S ribosome-binding factor RbfA [Chitinispirillales bacterium]|jgi:ribosome-binding factor A|nr:30S ribosome-binding factor RbfA [Chitinispirillales bacterium]